MYLGHVLGETRQGGLAGGRGTTFNAHEPQTGQVFSEIDRKPGMVMGLLWLLRNSYILFSRSYSYTNCTWYARWQGGSLPGASLLILNPRASSQSRFLFWAPLSPSSTTTAGKKMGKLVGWGSLWLVSCF